MAPLISQAIDLDWLWLTEALSGKRAVAEKRVAEDLWFWLQISTQSISNGSKLAAAGPDYESFDSAIADEFFAAATQTFSHKLTTTRSLWATLSRDSENEVVKASKRWSPRSLEKLQSQIGDGALVGAYLGGARHGFMLWITRDRVLLESALAEKAMQTRVASMLSRISDPSHDIASLRSALDDLSNQLFSAVASVPQPSSLMIWHDSILGALPWAAMRWPGNKPELVEDTAVSIVSMSSDCCSRPPTVSPIVHVVQSGNRDDLPKHLQALPSAKVENKLIESALGRTSKTEETNPDRQAIYDALKEPGDWVHIASHGQANLDRVGANGIWTRPSARDSGFVSGLDVLQHDVRSALVVVDACWSSANGYDGTRPVLSFAEAISIAGAHNVVAASWPVSDSASTLWVPAFYEAARLKPKDIANAMRLAQLRLRNSRMFHHPYFWASWTLLERLELPE